MSDESLTGEEVVEEQTAAEKEFDAEWDAMSTQGRGAPIEHEAIMEHMNSEDSDVTPEKLKKFEDLAEANEAIEANSDPETSDVQDEEQREESEESQESGDAEGKGEESAEGDEEEGEEEDEAQKEIRELKEQNALYLKAMNDGSVSLAEEVPVSVPTPESAPVESVPAAALPIPQPITIEPISDEKYTEIMTDKAAFEEYMADRDARSRQQTLAAVAPISDATTAARLDVDSFMKDEKNKDVLPVFNMVMTEANSVATTNPTFSVKQTLDHASDRVRKALKLSPGMKVRADGKVSVPREEVKKNRKSGKHFAPGTKTRKKTLKATSQEKITPEQADVAKQMEEMHAAHQNSRFA